MIDATGLFSNIVGGPIGMTANVAGAVPKEHDSDAPITTGCPIGSMVQRPTGAFWRRGRPAQRVPGTWLTARMPGRSSAPERAGEPEPERTREVHPASAERAWWTFGVAVVRALGRAEAGEDAAHGDDVAQRQTFRRSLATTAAFSTIVVNAGLDEDAAEVLAVLAAAEFDPVLHHEIGALQRDRAKNRITLGTLLRLFAGFGGTGHRGGALRQR